MTPVEFHNTSPCLNLLLNFFFLLLVETVAFVVKIIVLLFHLKFVMSVQIHGQPLKSLILKKYLMIVKVTDPNIHLVILIARVITLNFDEHLKVRLMQYPVT